MSPDLYVALACLVSAGAADVVSGIFRGTLWNQTIPDELRGRLAGVELVSGGLFCVGAVVLIAGLLPRFVRYRAEPAPE